MILLWTLDQHGGQAKGLFSLLHDQIYRGSNMSPGLGLHLQDVVRSLPDKLDLHECSQTLSSLGPYNHLWRLICVCYTHAKRNIQKCNVSDDVLKLMRSLLCVSHPDWDGTLELIQ